MSLTAAWLIALLRCSFFGKILGHLPFYNLFYNLLCMMGRHNLQCITWHILTMSMMDTLYVDINIWRPLDTNVHRIIQVSIDTCSQGKWNNSLLCLTGQQKGYKICVAKLIFHFCVLVQVCDPQPHLIFILFF